MNGQVDSARKKQARDLRRGGLSQRGIASRLSLSKTTIGRWLKGYSPGQEDRGRVKLRPQARGSLPQVKSKRIVQGQGETYAGQGGRDRPTGQENGQRKGKKFPGWLCLLLIVGALGFFLFQMCLRNLDKPKPEPEAEAGKSEGFDGRPFDNQAP